MSTRSVTRLSPRCLAAALVAGLAFTVAPTTPVAADDYQVVRQPRVRVAPARVRAPVRHVRVRTAARAIPVYYGPSCGCVEPIALPYYWAVRYAWYAYGGYYR